jgi:hypothetical protein
LKARLADFVHCVAASTLLGMTFIRGHAMQNTQNLMSSFEFIAALMSIIVGLGVTNLLAGAGRAFYRRKENPLDEVHLVLTLATLLLLSLQWWVTFKWNTEANWSFDKFLVLIVWTITLYMLTVFCIRLIYRKRKNTKADSNETGRAIILRLLRCAYSTSCKPESTRTYFIRFGICLSSGNTPYSLPSASLHTVAGMIVSLRGTN